MDLNTSPCKLWTLIVGNGVIMGGIGGNLNGIGKHQSLYVGLQVSGQC